MVDTPSNLTFKSRRHRMVDGQQLQSAPQSTAQPHGPNRRFLNFLGDLKNHSNFLVDVLSSQLNPPASYEVKAGVKYFLHFVGLELCLGEATQYHGQVIEFYGELRHNFLFFRTGTIWG
jgi:hypothetical protein